MERPTRLTDVFPDFQGEVMLMLTLTHSFLHKEMSGCYMVEKHELLQIT